MNSFSRQLKSLRKAKKILQKEIASLLGITVRSCQRYEKGEQEPCIDSLIILADYFDVSLDYLVGRSEKPKGNKRKNKRKDEMTCKMCLSYRL